jgi:hypothetical protein
MTKEQQENFAPDVFETLFMWQEFPVSHIPWITIPQIQAMATDET